MIMHTVFEGPPILYITPPEVVPKYAHLVSHTTVLR